MNRVGMHQLTYAKFTGNTFLRGVASNGPRDYSYEPGTSELVVYQELDWFSTTVFNKAMYTV
jgi:hypothetical protein